MSIYELTLTGSKDNPSEKQPVILNGVLAYTRFLMASRDKTFIQKTILSKYNNNFDILKQAYKVLYEFSGERCTYQGPRSKSGYDKCVDAFDKFYDLLLEYDTGGKTPVIAYPNEELSLFMSGAVAGDVYEKRFSDMETSITELKQTFHTFTGLLTSMPSLHEQQGLSSGSVPGTHQAGPLGRVRDDGRQRSDSSGSMKRLRSEDADNTANESNGEDTPFEVPSQQKKKMLRRENHKSSGKRSFAETLVLHGKSTIPTGQRPVVTTKAPVQSKRREGVWGKKKADSTTLLRGVPRKEWVPQVFLYRCDKSSEADDVKEYLTSHNLGVTEVELKSHPDSVYKSFIITVSSKKDFDELISGVHLPENVLVRRYWRPRPDTQALGQAQKSNFSKSMKDLEAMADSVLSPESVIIHEAAEQGKTKPIPPLPATDELMTSSQMTGNTA